MEKLYNEKGEVLVAVSPGYGAGWSTWNDISPLDKEFNELFLKNDLDSIYKLLKERDEYSGGVEDVILVPLPKNTKFRITEYDGSETLEIIDELDYLVA